MKPRKLKELLVFAIVHKAPELIPASKKETLEEGLMKLNTDELETLEDFLSNIVESAKPTSRRRKDLVVDGVEGVLDEESGLEQTA